MGLRRSARELALKGLYQCDISGDCSRETLHLLFSSFAPIDQRAALFARTLLDGVLENRPQIDHTIDDALAHWSIERLSRIDHNILRLAVFELSSLPDVPTRVTIDEAIELAKRYGDRNSSQFVNGVLDELARRLGVRDKGEERTATKPE